MGGSACMMPRIIKKIVAFSKNGNVQEKHLSSL